MYQKGMPNLRNDSEKCEKYHMKINWYAANSTIKIYVLTG